MHISSQFRHQSVSIYPSHNAQTTHLTNTAQGPVNSSSAHTHISISVQTHKHHTYHVQCVHWEMLNLEFATFGPYPRLFDRPNCQMNRSVSASETSGWEFFARPTVDSWVGGSIATPAPARDFKGALPYRLHFMGAFSESDSLLWTSFYFLLLLFYSSFGFFSSFNFFISATYCLSRKIWQAHIKFWDFFYSF